MSVLVPRLHISARISLSGGSLLAPLKQSNKHIGHPVASGGNQPGPMSPLPSLYGILFISAIVG